MGEIADRFEMLSPYLVVEEVGDVVVLRLTDEVIYLALDLESKSALWRLFDTCSTSPGVGAVLLLGTPRCFGAEQVNRFWRHVLAHDDPRAALRTPHARHGETDLHREGTAHQQFAMKVRECAKPVVVALQGEVEMPFLGNSLVCDYRVAAEGTVFRNRSHELGIPPGGAITCLLPAYVGYGKASAILLEGRDITVAEAFDLGLVNRVAPAAELEAAALEAACHFADLPPHVVGAVKRLLSSALASLGPHYELESKLIDGCLPDLTLEKLEP